MPRAIALSLLMLCATAPAFAADEGLPAQTRQDIDQAVNEILQKSGAPSASIAVVKDGKLVYEQAYGTANLEAKKPANPKMRYSIGSISKQFTAAAALLLVEDGRLSLDDKVVRWLPDLTRAKDVTLRQLLSMTSGYQDFWPQDYVMPMMRKNTTPRQIVDGWAKKPLDFEPGTKWQYSNTNYVIAGMIIEQVAGMPLMQFLSRRLFVPLKMGTVMDTDQSPLPSSDPMRYQRFALAPPRPAPKEGKGWMFAAGELAMTAHDLALWNISVMDQSFLRPESYRALETEVQLQSGVGTGYGLGLSVTRKDQRRVLAHGGEVSGFTANNTVFPDDRVAITVLVNLDASDASSQIAGKIAEKLFTTTDADTARALDTAKTIFAGLQKGQLNRAYFTDNANAYFDAQALKDFQTSLAPLGEPTSFTQAGQSLRGGMTARRYKVKFADRTVGISTFWMAGGKLEQFLVSAGD